MRTKGQEEKSDGGTPRGRGRLTCSGEEVLWTSSPTQIARCNSSRSSLYRRRSSDLGATSGLFGTIVNGSERLASTRSHEIPRDKWRRRPDLNRGWRFCRPYRVVDSDAWLRLLVPDGARLSLVFGRCCSEIGPKHRSSALMRLDVALQRESRLLRFEPGFVDRLAQPSVVAL